MAMGSKGLHQQKRDAALTDIPQNSAISKNVTQHRQIYPKTGRQHKRDAARTDIPQIRAFSKNVMRHGQTYPKTGPSAKT